MASSLPQDVLTALNDQMALRYCMFSCITILVYDVVITFKDEVSCVWKRRKLSGATVLFVLNRYSYLASMFFYVLTNFGHDEKTRCTGLQAVYYMFEGIALTVTALVSALRVWAIMGQLWTPFLLILPISLSVPAMNFWFWTTLTYTPISSPLDAPFGGCLFFPAVDPNILTRVSTSNHVLSIVTDAFVLIATWSKTLHIKKQAFGLGVRLRLSTLLNRDGTIYFLVLLLLNIASLVIDHTSLAAYNPMALYIDTASCILISRLLLHLRTYTVTEEEDSTPIHSKIHFASTTLLGNLGAPVENPLESSDSSTLAPSLRVTRQQAIENPLSLGLIPYSSEMELQRTDIGRGIKPAA